MAPRNRHSSKRSDAGPLPLYRIHNAPQLAARLRAALRHAGVNQKEACARVGVSESQLSKLVKARLGLIREDTLRCVLELFPAAERSQVAESLLSPAANEAHAAYELWLQVWNDEFLNRREPNPSQPGEDLDAWVDADTQALLERTAALCGETLDRYWRRLKDLGHVRAARPLVGDPEAGGDRYLLGIYRTLEVFDAADETSGIERNWRELDDDEFRRFVKLGIDRELILLERAPHLERAQMIGGEAVPPSKKRQRRRRR